MNKVKIILSAKSSLDLVRNILGTVMMNPLTEKVRFDVLISCVILSYSQ